MTRRILVLDDHELLAQSLSFALRAQGFSAEPLPLADYDTLAERVRADPPDVVLLDLQLGGDIGHGLRLVRPFTEAGARILVVSGVTDRCEIAATVEAGAVGYVCKSEPFEVLLDAAVRVAQGKVVLSDESRRSLLAELRLHRAEQQARRVPFERLSPRERQVLQALCDGKAVTTIATEWVTSVPTVRTQVRAILTKLGVGSQLEAVAEANRCGWYLDPQLPQVRSA